jgi:hypothetical protein
MNLTNLHKRTDLDNIDGMYKRNSNNSSTSRHTHLLEQAWGSGGGGRAGEEGGLRPGVEAHGLGSGVVMVILSRLWPAPFVVLG